jgi:hypothetical protein
VVSDDLVKRLLANGLDECDEAVACVEALQAEIGILRTEKHADAEAIGHLQAQLAKAREDALREAAGAITSEINKRHYLGVLRQRDRKELKFIRERIISLLDTPTPAPSPDALVRAAEMMVKAYRKDSDRVTTAFYALEAALAAMKGGDT